MLRIDHGRWNCGRSRRSHQWYANVPCDLHNVAIKVTFRLDAAVRTFKRNSGLNNAIHPSRGMLAASNIYWFHVSNQGPAEISWPIYFSHNKVIGYLYIMILMSYQANTRLYQICKSRLAICHWSVLIQWSRQSGVLWIVWQLFSGLRGFYFMNIFQTGSLPATGTNVGE